MLGNSIRTRSYPSLASKKHLAVAVTRWPPDGNCLEITRQKDQMYTYIIRIEKALA
jgi:hypothetical protein